MWKAKEEEEKEVEGETILPLEGTLRQIKI